MLRNIGKVWFLIIYGPIYVVLNLVIDFIIWMEETDARWRNRI